MVDPFAQRLYPLVAGGGVERREHVPAKIPTSVMGLAGIRYGDSLALDVQVIHEGDLESVLHERPLDRVRAVDGDALVARSVGSKLDEHHGTDSQPRSRDAEGLARRLCEREDWRIELEVCPMQLDLKVGVDGGDGDGDGLRGGAVGETEEGLGDGGRYRRVDIRRHTEHGVVARLLDAVLAHGRVDEVEERLGDEHARVVVAEVGHKVVDAHEPRPDPVVQLVAEPHDGADETQREGGIESNDRVRVRPLQRDVLEHRLDGGSIVRQSDGEEEEAKGVVDPDSSELEFLDVRPENMPILSSREVRSDLVAVQVGVAVDEVGDRRDVVVESSALDEGRDGAGRIVRESIHKVDEEGVSLFGGRILDGRLLRDIQLDVLQLDDALDDERVGERRRERLSREGVVLDDGLGDDEKVVEEEEVTILDGADVDDLQDGRLEEEAARRVIQHTRLLRVEILRPEDRVEVCEDLVLW